ncbi:MAG: hypothetical protein KC964_19220, partial [Candidatus Omnitrophica bacterium]|nr:hypothetical protein [Candidatus Omnitrophota bacterium]
KISSDPTRSFLRGIRKFFDILGGRNIEGSPHWPIICGHDVRRLLRVPHQKRWLPNLKTSGQAPRSSTSPLAGPAKQK